jgi:hypothetical protein
VQLRDEDWKRSYKYRLRLALLGNYETEVFTRPTIHPHQIDLDMLATWRKRCDTEHEERCGPLFSTLYGAEPGTGDAAMTSWRVIDVTHQPRCSCAEKIASTVL